MKSEHFRIMMNREYSILKMKDEKIYDMTDCNPKTHTEKHSLYLQWSEILINITSWINVTVNSAEASK